MRTAAIRRPLRLGTLRFEPYYISAESESVMAMLEYPTIILPDGDKRFRSLEIDNSGVLIFEQTDLGKRTAEIAPNGADSDYEYWVTVKHGDAQKVFLELIKDTFATQMEFRKWLEAKDIQYSFDSY